MTGQRVRVKKSFLLIFLSLLICGCSRDAPHTDGSARTGSISGEVKLKKREGSLIYVALGKSLDELALGRPVRLVVLQKPGAFRFDDVDAGTYRVGAFVDIDADSSLDSSIEPYFVLESELSVSSGEDVEDIVVENFFNERDTSFKTVERVEHYQKLRTQAKAAVEGAYQRLKAEQSDLLFEVIPTLRAMVFEAETTWAVAGNESDWEHIKVLLEPVPKLASEAIEGHNRLGSLRGCFLRAYLSDLDGSVQRYAVYVPEEYDGSRSFPLVLALHGGGGDHWFGMKMVTGCSDLLIGAQESNRHFFPRRLPPDFIIASPFGHGYKGPGYRGRGEYDVMKVLKGMLSHYNIDENRVYLTGSSKGGRGTWEIGLKYPELFAALAPVCGGTGVARKLPDNAAGMRIFAFHGAKDSFVPVGESRAMVALLTQLGVPVRYFEYEELGHELASLAYKDGAIFDLFRS